MSCESYPSRFEAHSRISSTFSWTRASLICLSSHLSSLSISLAQSTPVLGGSDFFTGEALCVGFLPLTLGVLENVSPRDTVLFLGYTLSRTC